jgi:hypothetical protein
LTAIRRLGTDGKNSQHYQLFTRAGWCRFSLLVRIRAVPPRVMLSSLVSGRGRLVGGIERRLMVLHCPDHGA